MSARFEIILLEQAVAFIESQPFKVRSKILQNMRMAQGKIDPVWFKKLRNEIWEFRTRYAGNQYRLLAFWDKTNRAKTIVIATHGFIKKRRTTDLKEINKAMKIREEYFNSEKK